MDQHGNYRVLSLQLPRYSEVQQSATWCLHPHKPFQDGGVPQRPRPQPTSTLLAPPKPWQRAGGGSCCLRPPVGSPCASSPMHDSSIRHQKHESKAAYADKPTPSTHSLACCGVAASCRQDVRQGLVGGATSCSCYERTAFRKKRAHDIEAIQPGNDCWEFICGRRLLKLLLVAVCGCGCSLNGASTVCTSQ